MAKTPILLQFIMTKPVLWHKNATSNETTNVDNSKKATVTVTTTATARNKIREDANASNKVTASDNDEQPLSSIKITKILLPPPITP